MEFVKRYIDLLALHKMNVFHWHLTEDQGWRIEIRSTRADRGRRVAQGDDRRPASARQAEVREFDGERHGGFYTQDEVREIVAYARERHITVVPEIEMPGHAQAALAAYPELGLTPADRPVATHVGHLRATSSTPRGRDLRVPRGRARRSDELFPGPFIHIGGDEAAKDALEGVPRGAGADQGMGLKDEDELQSWFIRRIDAFLTSHGRRLIGWDEILEGGLAPGAAVMSWRGIDGGIAAARRATTWS